MADPTTELTPIFPDESRRSPLAGWADRFARLAGLTLHEVPFRTELNLQLFGAVDPADARLAQFGLDLPAIPCTFRSDRDGAALWLGPREWLIIRPSAWDGFDELAVAVAGQGAITDVSAQRTTLRLAGPGAVDVLAHGCAIDLDPAVTPAGSCVQTMLARSNVILTVLEADEHGDPIFELRVRSSFAEYLATWLVDAAADIPRRSPVT